MITEQQAIHIRDLVQGIRFVPERDDFLVSLAKGKTVLHIGACDSPFHLIKAKENCLLQQKLSACAVSAIGVDTDTVAIGELAKVGIKDIFTYDTLPALAFDVTICGETIEHVTNFDDFFSSLKRIDARSIVFSTPNAYFYARLFRATTKRETHHLDHKVIFTPYILAQILTHYSLNVEGLFTTFIDRSTTGGRSMKSKIMARILPAFPMFGETLVAVASFSR